MKDENKSPFHGESADIESNEINKLKNDNYRRDIKSRFYSDVILSKPFKILFICILYSLTFFLGLLLLKLLYYVCLKDFESVSGVFDILYKIGVPYIGFLSYLLNFGKEKH
jgi:hypothetical protein